mgnify:FL=1
MECFSAYRDTSTLLYTTNMSLVDLLKLVFWAVVFILALSFFGISIQAIVNSPTGQENVQYISHLLNQVWLWATYWIRPS